MNEIVDWMDAHIEKMIVPGSAGAPAGPAVL